MSDYEEEITASTSVGDYEFIHGCDAAHPDRRGGQHVAMKCTAVRILHRPSGIAVTCMSERSQHGNRVKAMELLTWLLEQTP